YATTLWGIGAGYRLNRNWDLTAGATFSPQRRRDVQPQTMFVSAGFTYTMRPLSMEQVDRNSDNTVVFPVNVVQAGYISDALGYGVNDFFSRGAVPVFWSADVKAARGFSFDYQRNTFHTRRVFSLDAGAGITSLKGKKEGESFVTASIYPVLRFTLLRTKSVDFFVD